MTPYDVEDQQCVSCRTHTLFVDFSQGDTICRECGLVHSEKLIYDGPEWTDYNKEDGSERPSVVRAGGVVDETKWKGGGLEPTHLGKVFGPCKGDSERYRKRLNKVKRNVDFYFEKQYEIKLKESKMVMNLKKRKASTLQEEESLNSHLEDTDYTDYGTNEHERIITEEADHEESLQNLLISQKWSLDRAILLHGSSDELPSYQQDDNSDPHNYHTNHIRDLDAERKTLQKAMDASQLKASQDLYVVYKMVEQALQRLKLSDNRHVLKDIMTMMCRYASIKGSFQVRGVGSRCDKSRTEEEQVQDRQEDKHRQMGSLACAFIFLYCKKYGLGRSLIDICSSFQSNRKRSHHAPDEKDNNGMAFDFIKAKHCSKALSEIRIYFPDYVQFATNTAHHEKSDSTDGVPCSNEIVCTDNTASITDHQSMNLRNLVMHGSRDLFLPTIATEAIIDTVLIIHGRHEHSFHNHVKPSVMIAAATFFICQLGEIMQRLSLQMSNKTSIKVEVDDTSSISFRQVVTPEPEPEPFDILSHGSEQNETFQNESCWLEWRGQKPWVREFNDICKSFHAVKSSTLDFYQNHVYLIRKEILKELKRNVSQSHDKSNSRLSIMLLNTDAAASLMKTKTK